MNIIIKKIKAIKRLGIIGTYHRLMYMYMTRERRCTFGPKNIDKTFYVIRGIDHESKHYKGVAMNLLANYSYVLSHMIYADKKGWIPVVDQTNDPVNTKENFKVNDTDNPWEYFWQQPANYSLEEVYQSKNVVLSKRSWYVPGDLGYSAEAHKNPYIIHKFHDLSNRIPLNRATEEYILNAEHQMDWKDKCVLGVTMRRGGYAKEDEYHAPGHPIQPSPNEMLDLVKKRVMDWNIDLVFLATEEEQYVTLFRKTFGDKLCVIQRERYNGWRRYGEAENPLYQPGQRYLTALNYLTEMELLSKCDCAIGSITSGFRYSIIRNNLKYINLEISENGFWSL